MSSPPTSESLQADLRALYAVWSATSVDSYTMGTFRKKGSLIHIEHHSVKGYQARVLSAGQLASVQPELHSEWFASSQDAQLDVVSKALQFYRTLGLLTKDNKPKVLLVADNSKTGVAEQLKPSIPKSLANNSFVMNAQPETHITGTEHREICDMTWKEVREDRQPWMGVKYGWQQPI
jgi:hypothetical protein